MGDKGNNGLESRFGRLAKAPFRFARSYAVPAGVATGIGAAILGYWMITRQKVPSPKEIKDVYLDLDFWKEELLRWPIYALVVASAFCGILALNNQIRKRKGKRPIKILKYLKQTIFPSSVSKGEKGFMEFLDSYPAPSLTYRGLGNLYFGQGRIIEAMESYYEMIRTRDDEIIPKIPVLGTNSYVNIIAANIRRLEERLRDESGNNQVLLELAMNYFSINDFENAVRRFENVDKGQDPVALHILASRFYSEISKRAGRPRLRRMSFGDSGIGMMADKAVYFWDRQKISQKELKEKAEKEALDAVERILQLEDLEQHLQPIGDYEVYRIALNSLVKGFVVLKRKKGGDYNALAREKKNEEIFEQRIATGRFRSVHPVRIVSYKDRDYLVLLYEEGTPLAGSTNPRHFRDAMRFAARSDALMPLEHVLSREYNPQEHFVEERLSALPDNVKPAIAENSDFMFRYSEAFPIVFDGDWRPDGNCLVNADGCIIALDKEGKGVTIGPVTTARILNQGTSFAESDGLKDSLIDADYLPVYHEFSNHGRRIDNPELFLPVTLTKTMEKAIAACCFTLDKPSQQSSAQIFLRNALHAGNRLRHDQKIRRFYSDNDRKQCAAVEKAIYEHLLKPAARAP